MFMPSVAAMRKPQQWALGLGGLMALTFLIWVVVVLLSKGLGL